MNPDNLPSSVTLILPNGESKSLFALTYDGSSDFGDYYTARDVFGQTYRWAIAPNSDDFANYKEGSLSGFTANDLTPPPAPRAPDRSPEALTRPVASDPSHVYVSTANGRDNWRQVFGNGVYTWQTLVGQTSGSIIRETFQFTPDASASAGAIVNTDRTGGSAATVPAATNTPTGDASNLVTGGNQGGGGPNGAPAGRTVGAVRPADAGARSSASHVYVGRDARGDVWQTFDGNRVLEWAVAIGDQSAAVIDGTLRDLGAPSAGTVAQRPTTPGANSVVTPAAVEDAKGKLIITAAALLAKVLIFS